MPLILLVHADTDDREMYAEYLRMAGFDVVEASSTDLATAFVETCDLLVTGLMVPGKLDPIELIAGATAGRWGKSVPAVVVTACVVHARHCQATQAGATAVLLKPCPPGDLLATVRESVQRARTRPAIVDSGVPEGEWGASRPSRPRVS